MTVSSPIKYNRPMIFLHWMMLVLIVATYAFIEFRGIFPKGTDARTLMKLMHFSLGLSLLILVCIRGYYRITTPVLTRHLSIGAKVGHLFLYAFLLVMPLLGWLIVSAEGKDVSFYFMTFPSLISENKELAHTLEDWHELLGEVGYWVIGGHAAMALYHHYIKHEPTFKRMTP